MISTFDLILLGGLISLGGLMFLFRAYRPQSAGSAAGIAPTVTGSSPRGRNETRQRAEAMAGARWLTIGALVLFVGYTRGSDSGYLFDFWGDLMFHTVLLSGCWAATAFRLNRTDGKQTLRPARVSNLPTPSPSSQTVQQ